MIFILLNLRNLSFLLVKTRKVIIKTLDKKDAKKGKEDEKEETTSSEEDSSSTEDSSEEESSD